MVTTSMAATSREMTKCKFENRCDCRCGHSLKSPSNTDGINLNATGRPSCEQVIAHATSGFCQYCRATPMPWGDEDLPVVTDDLGIPSDVIVVGDTA
jgi:hypothetical protein